MRGERLAGALGLLLPFVAACREVTPTPTPTTQAFGHPEVKVVAISDTQLNVVILDPGYNPNDLANIFADNYRLYPGLSLEQRVECSKEIVQELNLLSQKAAPSLRKNYTQETEIPEFTTFIIPDKCRSDKP